ncbi:hypothetical protein H9Y04_42320 [Streptomyces sp. TRM66268-LWL]|uniref:Nudix hydrolase domain-containing protein n=1 Tax=Streptomyces polyasparticus TaxID=2767826 RepID=A0ABR7SY26_9ACTN|nr:hypothetical protein [Streptomyces polyasparticus]MBC9719168.1 hypothetical protein [Streptomyces polyasparticus]
MSMGVSGLRSGSASCGLLLLERRRGLLLLAAVHRTVRAGGHVERPPGRTRFH